MIDALTRGGYCPRTTPVDALMAGPASMHLQAAADMGADHTDPDDDLGYGFQTADFDSEYAEGLIELGLN